MDIDLRDLELLDALGRHRTLTAAARHLYVSQPALSQRLLRLEERLATPLFERRGRLLHVTKAGTRMLAAARVTLAELDAAHAELRELAADRAAPLRIASQCNTNYAWLAEVVQEHRRTAPDMTVEVAAEAGADPIAAVIDGGIDLALVTKLDASSQQVRLDPIFDDELIAVVAANHPWSRLQWVSADDFADVHLVMYEAYDPNKTPPLPLPIPPTAQPGQLSTPPVGTDMLVEMVAGGEMVTVLSRWIAAPYLQRPDLSAVPIGEAGSARTWYAATRHRPRPEHLDHFVTTIVHHFANTTAGQHLT